MGVSNTLSCSLVVVRCGCHSDNSCVLGNYVAGKNVR